MKHNRTLLGFGRWVPATTLSNSSEAAGTAPRPGPHLLFHVIHDQGGNELAETPVTANDQASAETEDVEPAGFGRRPVLVTTAICGIVGALGHAVLWIGEGQDWIDRGIYWEPVVGIAIVVVSITSFGGFYVASRRTRVAIAASFLLTFLVSLTYVLTTQALADAASRGAAKDVFDDFRTVVVTILASILAARRLSLSLRSWALLALLPGGATAVTIRRMDRDLQRTVESSIESRG